MRTRGSRLASSLLLLTLPTALAAAVPPRAVELHQRGYAELENENPAAAEPLYREVIRLTLDDPLGYANLAIALLRQQKYEAAARVLDQGLEVVPEHPRLLSIRGELLQWTGELEGALEILDRAAQLAPDDPETLYGAYQLAESLEGERAEGVALRVLERLAELRPENVVVLLELGQRAIAAGDRGRATGAFGRIGELLWQAEPIAERAYGMLVDALRDDDLAQARVPSLRLENVLKVTPMFREGLRELKTAVQGLPIAEFRDTPAPTRFGAPREITFHAAALDDRPTSGRALTSGDFDGDSRPDLARARAGGGLEIRLARGGWKVSHELAAGDFAAGDFAELLAADLDNDGHLDLAAFAAAAAAVWLGQGDGTFQPAAGALGLAAAGASGAAVIDFDIEGDLDLALVGGTSGAGELFRNNLQGPLQRIGDRSLPRGERPAARAVRASDLDRDGDLDLVIAHGRGLTWLDNLRQGRFVERGAAAGLGPSTDLADAPLADVVSADLDNDGLPDLVGAGRGGLTAWRNRGGSFTPRPLGAAGEGSFAAVTAFDADNDGRLDLAAAGEGGVVVLTQDAAGGFMRRKIEGFAGAARALLAADLDQDGDLDLAVAGPAGLAWLENRGGDGHRFLALRLRGLDKGSSKNNALGFGATVEVRSGLAYQFREVTGDVVHLGLGEQETADVVRVVWTNGVPQNRLAVAGDQRIVEQQLLKGSCPFVYVWDGEGWSFLTDLLWAAPLGLPLAPGVWAPIDPAELVRLDGLVDDGGLYRLRLTEELWEAAFFDQLRLWVVDHPAEVEVASNLRVLPGERLPEKVLGSRELWPVAAAWDGRGRDVTHLVARRDEVYADGYTPSPYQGLAAAPWHFTFDLGRAPARPVRLHLDGWIFPTDASLNLAIAQRPDLVQLLPRLEVETAAGWTTLIERLGFPAGKTKTMVIDTPPLPAGARRLRIVTSLWLHWDRLAWTLQPADGESRIVGRLPAATADLRYRGFSTVWRRAPNAPHVFDYARHRASSPWLPLPGRYTRYGDVRALLAEADDRSVILAPGDEIAVTFDGRHLPPPVAGSVRTLFLESHGWDKDADRNTWQGHRLEPLPFRAMSGYPWGPGEAYPDTPAHRAYRRRWLTREIP